MEVKFSSGMILTLKRVFSSSNFGGIENYFWLKSWHRSFSESTDEEDREMTLELVDTKGLYLALNDDSFEYNTAKLMVRNVLSFTIFCPNINQTKAFAIEFLLAYDLFPSRHSILA